VSKMMQASSSPVIRCKKIFCGEQRTAYFYLALGKYGSYHGYTSSYVEKSILHKLDTKFYQKNNSGRANLGRNLAKFLLYKLLKMKVVTSSVGAGLGGNPTSSPSTYYTRYSAQYIRSRKQGDTDGTSNIVLPCPSS
jgi:hypothetical protein